MVAVLTQELLRWQGGYRLVEEGYPLRDEGPPLAETPRLWAWQQERRLRARVQRCQTQRRGFGGSRSLHGSPLTQRGLETRSSSDYFVSVMLQPLPSLLWRAPRSVHGIARRSCSEQRKQRQQ